MDVLLTFAADREPAELAEPGLRPLDYPAMPPEPVAALDADPDVPPGERATTTAAVVRLVGMQFAWALASPSVGLPDRRVRIDQILKHQCRLAPVRRTASGVPARSTTTGRFVPGTLWV